MAFKGSNPKPVRPVSDEVPTMSYEEAGILEYDIGDTCYRIDSGRQGTALALSSKPVGTWDWAFVAEMKWDGSDLKCRALDFETRRELAIAFKQAIEDLD
jgi:hypothetical protein